MTIGVHGGMGKGESSWFLVRSSWLGQTVGQLDGGRLGGESEARVSFSCLLKNGVEYRIRYPETFRTHLF